MWCSKPYLDRIPLALGREEHVAHPSLLQIWETAAPRLQALAPVQEADARRANAQRLSDPQSGACDLKPHSAEDNASTNGATCTARGQASWRAQRRQEDTGTNQRASADLPAQRVIFYNSCACKRPIQVI
jgi:hypothetical protein